MKRPPGISCTLTAILLMPFKQDKYKNFTAWLELLGTVQEHHRMNAFEKYIHRRLIRKDISLVLFLHNNVCTSEVVQTYCKLERRYKKLCQQ